MEVPEIVLGAAEVVRLQNVKTAELALADYNEKHHTDYKLVDALGSCGFLVNSVWYHTSFTAAPSTSQNVYPSAKRFFGELEYVRPDCPVVHCCCIVEGTQTKDGCLYCGGSLLHPVHGFRQGVPHQKGNILEQSVDLSEERGVNAWRSLLPSSAPGSSESGFPSYSDVGRWCPQIFRDDNGKWRVIKSPGAPSEPFEEWSHGWENHNKAHPPMKGNPPKIKPTPPPADSVDYSTLSDEECYRLQCVKSAEVALAYYNKKHHTDYILVEALCSSAFLVHHGWVHTSFTAKRGTSHNGDSPAKLFFAELEYGRLDPVIRCCRIIEGGKTTNGCLQCDGQFAHPTYGFRHGLRHIKYQPKRSRKKACA